MWRSSRQGGASRAARMPHPFVVDRRKMRVRAARVNAREAGVPLPRVKRQPGIGAPRGTAGDYSLPHLGFRPAIRGLRPTSRPADQGREGAFEVSGWRVRGKAGEQKRPAGAPASAHCRAYFNQCPCPTTAHDVSGCADFSRASILFMRRCVAAAEMTFPRRSRFELSRLCSRCDGFGGHRCYRPDWSGSAFRCRACHARRTDICGLAATPGHCHRQLLGGRPPRSAACLAVACGFDDRRYLPAATGGACGKRRALVRVGEATSCPPCCSPLPRAALSIGYLAGACPHDAELVLITVCAGMAAGGSVPLAPVHRRRSRLYGDDPACHFACKCLFLLGSGYALLGLLALSFAAPSWLRSLPRLPACRSSGRRLCGHPTQSAQLLRDQDATTSARKTCVSRTALDNMTPGSVLLRIATSGAIVCNQRYIESGTKLDGAARVRPGVSLSEIVEMRLPRRDAVPACRRKNITHGARKLAREHRPSESIRKMCDGRTFAALRCTSRWRMGPGRSDHRRHNRTRRAPGRPAPAENRRLLAHMASHDGSTGLPNRILFRERHGCCCGRHRARGRPA